MRSDGITSKLTVIRARNLIVRLRTAAVNAVLIQVYGVGQLTALTYVLTLDSKERFQRSRDVGCYLGLRPKR